MNLPMSFSVVISRSSRKEKTKAHILATVQCMVYMHNCGNTKTFLETKCLPALPNSQTKPLV